MFLTRLFTTLAILSIAITATAESITYSGSYDGSYDPTSLTPPAGQDTWAINPTITPTVNSTTGIATFTDNSTAGGTWTMLSRHRTGGVDGILDPFSADQSDDVFTISTRMKIGSNGGSSAGYGIGFGMYNEGNGSTLGKMMILNFYNGGVYDYPDNSTTGAGGITSTGTWLAGNGRCDPQESAIKLTSNSYYDDQWHTFTIEKYLDGEDAKVRFMVDEDTISSFDYDSMPDAYYAGEGLGLFGDSYATSTVEMDYFQYEITTDATAVPEPTTVASLVMLLVGLTVCAWRKRK